MENIQDADGKQLHENDRVYTYDAWVNHIIYGYLVKNDHPEVSEWAVDYDDNVSCAVLDFTQIWEA
jgi:hypothetical protein